MLKWAFVAAGVLALLVAAALAALPRLLDAPGFRAYVAQTASRALGRPVVFDSLSATLLPAPAVRLRGLAVAEDPAFGPGSFLSVAEGRMRLRLRPLLSGHLELADLTLDAPAIDLVEDDQGRWNWASLRVVGPGAPAAPRSAGRTGTTAIGAAGLSHVSVVDGAMRFRRLGGARSPDIRVEKINATVAQSGGALRLHGDAVVQPGGVKVVIADAVLTPTSARALGEMPVRATLVVDAPDVASIARVLTARPEMTGPMKGRFELSGTPARVVASGVMSVERLVMSEERARCQPRRRQLVLSDVRIPVAYSGAQLDTAPVDARLAQGVVSARVVVEFGPAPVATATDISVKGVELTPIMVDFLCHPYAITGPLDLAGRASGRAVDPLGSATGSGRLRIGPGHVVGRDVAKLLREALQVAGVSSAVVSPEQRVLAPLAFDSITATYTIAGGVVTTRDLLYESSELRVTAAGTYALRDGRVAMDITFTQGPNRISGVLSGTEGALRLVPTAVQIQDARGVRRFLEKIWR
ncbi:MAG TPA: AsmA family protein [Candidatus Methylomirabilis sp.]|nr:AsmA family protein [Candidatus Methylomirabilis sp.]